MLSAPDELAGEKAKCKACGRVITVPGSETEGERPVELEPAPPGAVTEKPVTVGSQAPVAPKTSGLAIASLVLGIVWAYGITSILAIIFGFVARKQIRESGGRLTGAGFALAGIILGFCSLALSLIAIISIIAAIAAPSLLRSRIVTNEVAAIGALRSIMAAQEEFRMADIIDQDEDGAGEYGFFQELCGTIAPPGYTSPVFPEFFDPVFGVIDASGCASKTGYFFKIYLPGPNPAGPEAGENAAVSSATPNADAINQREKRWVCYAWPVDYDSTGRRTFVINQVGNVFATDPIEMPYHSTEIMPESNAAYAWGTKNLNGPLADGTAKDGNEWHPIR
jgi:type II secretory pathway pseudopilin PulG